MTNIINDILNYLEVKHTKYYVNKLFDEHPHNDDMYGLKEMLKDYNIDSVGVESEDKNLSDIHFPSLFHTNSEFIIGLECVNNYISFIIGGKQMTMNYEDFSRMWDGKALVITSTEDAAEKEYYKHMCIEWMTRVSFLSLLVIPIIIVLFRLLISSYSTIDYFPIIINIWGCATCFSLIRKQLKKEHKIEDKFCSILNSGGCEAVLSSNDATVLYVFTWSEIGLSYFVANLLILIFANHYISGMVVINIFAMTFGLWSVWYQAFKLKKWCTLCVCAQIAIWILGIYYFIMIYFEKIRFINVLPLMIISFLTMFFVLANLHYLTLYFNYKNKITMIKRKLNMFQVDNDVLKAKYSKQKKYLDSKDFSTIHFGDINSMYQITILSNPRCSHCAKLHKEIEPLLLNKKLNFGIRFVFLSFGPEFDYACKLFIAAKHQLDKEKAIKVFSYLFENPQLQNDNPLTKFNINIDDEKVIKEYEMHKKWVAANQLKATPTILINGYTIPEPYEIKDFNKMDEL